MCPRSRQIRPPIYSMKQTKLRRKRVIRYAILYFVLLVVFVALLVAPTVAGPMIGDGAFPKALSDMHLVQPNNQNNNDTTEEETGDPDEAAEETTAADKVKFLVI